MKKEQKKQKLDSRDFLFGTVSIVKQSFLAVFAGTWGLLGLLGLKWGFTILGNPEMANLIDIDWCIEAIAYIFTPVYIIINSAFEVLQYNKLKRK